MNKFVWIARAAALAAAVLCITPPADAQYRPRPVSSSPTTGENYHIELGADIWMPTADMTVSSESLNIPGSQIDFKRDLGLVDQRFPSLQGLLKGGKHKLRFQYLPVNYTQTATLSQRLVFNGIAYNLGVPVNSSLDWKTYEFGYEYDFISRTSGFVGVILDAKYTDVTVNLASPLNTEFAHAKGLIPAIGGIARYYVVPMLSITGEVTGVKIPDRLSTEYHAHYVDVDIYGTINLTNNLAAKAGYRSRDVGYLFKTDSGTFVMQGLYFGGVLRY